MDSRIMAMRMERWREIIVACNTSGMKKNEWMRIHNVSQKMFYRKQKELREYEMKKAGITDIPAGQKPAEFFDLTTALKQQMNGNSAQTCCDSSSVLVPQDVMMPELMIQVGPYNLYIRNGVTEATLATVLKVVKNA